MPSCDLGSPRERWKTAPGEPFPFAIVCPRNGRVSKVGDVGYRLTITPSQPPPPAGQAP